jgi:hypothetical protein
MVISYQQAPGGGWGGENTFLALDALGLLFLVLGILFALRARSSLNATGGRTKTESDRPPS